jgi:hypothetical protein
VAYHAAVNRAGEHPPAAAARPESRAQSTEQVWEELREKTLANRGFPALRRLENSVCEGLTYLAGDPERVRSLTDFPYMRITF